MHSRERQAPALWARLVVVCLIATGLAGCTAPEDEVHVEVDASLGLVPPETLADGSDPHWWFGALEATPEGSVAAFTWQVTNTTLLHLNDDPFTRLKSGVIAEQADIEQLGLFLLRLDADQATWLSGRLYTDFLYQDLRSLPSAQTPPGHATTFAGEASFDSPSASTFPPDVLKEGDRLALVVAVRGTGPVALVIEPDGTKPPEEESRIKQAPARTTSAWFQGLIEKGGAAPLEPLGNGTGFQGDLYLQDGRGSGSVHTSHRVIHAGTATSTSHPLQGQQAGGLDHETRTETTPAPGGWTLAMAYAVSGNTVGDIALQVTGAPQEVDVSGSFDAMTKMRGGQVAVGDGGDYHATLQMTYQSLEYTPTVQFLGVRLGVPMALLLGMPGPEGHWTVDRAPFSGDGLGPLASGSVPLGLP